MSYSKPSIFSEEAMTDRLCAEHERGEHEQFSVNECPKCEEKNDHQLNLGQHTNGERRL